MSTAPISAATDVKHAVHRRLLADAFDPARATRAELRARLSELLHEEAPLVDVRAAALVLDELVTEVDGLGPLERWLDDASVTEIMVNGPGRAYVERAGEVVRVPCPLDAADIARLAERIVAPLGLRLDRSSPMVDAWLPDGSRLHAVLPPLAPDGPCLTIRRFPTRAVLLERFGVDGPREEFVRAIVRGGWNLLVAGGTSAGKTTLCNALAGAIDDRERIVTIEETAELRLGQPHVVRLEARPANAEGVGEVRVRDLVRAALRMRPDRLIVGEVRGPEALDMLQALNTGHDGSLSTIHANDPAAALSRLETLALLAGVGLPLGAIRAQVAAAVDAVVFVARGAGGHRLVRAVAEVEPGADGAPRARPLLVRDGGELVCAEHPVRGARRAGVDLREEWERCRR